VLVLAPRASTSTALAAGFGGFALGPGAHDMGPGADGAAVGLLATPEHPHAYVAFGAGMRQREVDMFTAAHPLPALRADGKEARVPYHVPL
jgi:hypothetical protein